MKKLLFIAVLLCLIIPSLHAFKSVHKSPAGVLVKPSKSPHRVFSKKSPTTWDIGSIYANGVSYEVYGDNYGGSSGNIVDIQVGGVSVSAPYSGTWDHNGGVPGTLLWVYVTFFDFNGPPQI
ncbi:hypothetical protein BEL04_11415 [Mucilaginibacter sp. PPCGB 2223]|uniref:hypothetical protein n=1 Tax=Mucilaginibacter sp. PPCGB 2223 TaxID=1886027 RepID=UPI0008267D48|nr:hypothetical protein [Mucilaginibacter sp. PPCGB 2223]OCX52100.1 hypothetical protein BEL04_11415 [Mucilaginibacter sp. PPCGB 2223]